MGAALVAVANTTPTILMWWFAIAGNNAQSVARK
jgi:hypothetical protein